ncbi:putative disease resistance protein At3g14460 [Pistacia vera]|uniref:putative disease resistance protein At3g14460 n=1 Tax=Pistacia vera TaxID=55513 RepID=UPI001262AD3B|nr:putative disease resistance protein At3g14460 [Pistacia vera]
MGGIGKTTLARQVFNDEAVKDFDPKVWVSVSDHDHFDVQKISKIILAEITSESSDVETLNQLQVKLRSLLAGKKFLLVLDDVWNEDYDKWENLKAPFMAGAPGSRIIVTTRNLKVVSTMTGSFESHNVKLLSEEECWSLFAKLAFENKDIAKFTNLEYIRQKVASKCNGLPLAARTLGGLLRSEPRESKWENILDSNIWEDALYSSKQSEIPAALKLSYHYLPSHLKRCFAYCAIFPKNHEFEEEELVLLWMAEGLIQKLEDNMELEDVGGEYFQDLLSRSLFQKSSNTDSSTYVMHDLVNDLAKWASGDTSFRLEDELRINNQEVLKKIRYLSSVPGGPRRYNVGTKFEALHAAVNLRTIFELHGASRIHFLELLPKFKKLRVLSLLNVNEVNLPDTIGDLKHLRYLKLSDSMITRLPKSINSLINLEVLVLQLPACGFFKRLPPMGNLINLRHLNIPRGILKKMPLGMENWKNLRTLSEFVVAKDSGSGLEVLNNFKFLRGKLHISELKNATSFSPEAILCDKEKLDELWLEWYCDLRRYCGNGDEDCQSEEVQKNVLDKLRPHKNLKKLRISGYGGTQFPDWLGNLSLSLTSLETLEIDDCDKLQRLFYDREVGTSSSSSSRMDTQHFNLKITNCPSLMSLSSTGQLPKTLEHLGSLEIYDCDSLTCIVRGQLPSSLRKLSVDSCYKLKCLLDDTEDVGTSSLSSSSVMHREIIDNTRISQLEDLDIRSCSSLACLSSKGLSLTKLKHLKIESCPNLPILLLEDQPTEAPEYPIVPSCEKLELIAKRFHKNMALQDICMSYCYNLRSLPEGLHNLNCLRKILISNCHSLLSFPDERLPSTIREVCITECQNLKALPNGIHTLNSLQELYISGCPRITFPEEGLPTSLTSLTVAGPNICKPLMEWGLQKLTSLKYLGIGWGLNKPFLTSHSTNEGSDAESFPGEWMFPPSLTKLFIFEFPKLKYLSSQAFQNLTSLQHLEISGCPYLTSFPEEGLPSSLLKLMIFYCDRLKKSVRRKKDKEWSKIAHIPEIRIS